MGLSFPCGRFIEELAKQNNKEIPKPNICVKEFSCNISGLENLAANLYEKTKDKQLVSAYVLNFISKTLVRLTINLRKKYEKTKIIFAGGVMSNSFIQNELRNMFENVYFASPEFSSDNAAGIAILTLKEYRKRG